MALRKVACRLIILSCTCVSGCGSDSREGLARALPEAFGAYAADGSVKLAEYLFESSSIDCYQMQPFKKFEATGFRLEPDIVPVVEHSLLLHLADPSSADQFRLFASVSNQQMCGCGKCTAPLWDASRELTIAVSPVQGQAAFFMVTPNAPIEPQLYLLVDPSRGRAFPFAGTGWVPPARFVGTWSNDFYPIVEVVEQPQPGRYRIRVCYGKDATDCTEMTGRYAAGEVSVEGREQDFYKGEVPSFAFVEPDRLLFSHGAGPHQLTRTNETMPRAKFSPPRRTN